jgi:hypothetical protein
MCGIDTATNPTEVVERQAVRDWTDEEFVGKAVGFD